MLIILMLGAAALIAAYFLQGKTRPDTTTPPRTMAEILWESVKHQALPFGLVALFAFLALWFPITNDPWVPTIAANVAMVATAFWLIRLGLAEAAADAPSRPAWPTCFSGRCSGISICSANSAACSVRP